MSVSYTATAQPALYNGISSQPVGGVRATPTIGTVQYGGQQILGAQPVISTSPGLVTQTQTYTSQAIPGGIGSIQTSPYSLTTAQPTTSTFIGQGAQVGAIGGARPAGFTSTTVGQPSTFTFGGAQPSTGGFGIQTNQVGGFAGAQPVTSTFTNVQPATGGFGIQTNQVGGFTSAQPIGGAFTGVQQPSGTFTGVQPATGGFAGAQQTTGTFTGLQPATGAFTATQPSTGGFGIQSNQVAGFPGAQQPTGTFTGARPAVGGFGVQSNQIGSFGGAQPSTGGFGFQSNQPGLLSQQGQASAGFGQPPTGFGATPVPSPGGIYGPQPPVNAQGTLILRPQAGKFLKAHELIGKMDPYVVFTSGQQKVQTSIAKSGGKEPVWHDVLQLPISGQPDLRIQVLDKEMIFKDEFVGEAVIPMNNLVSQRIANNWYPLFEKNGQPAGQILLETEFQPFGVAPNTYAGGFGGTGYAQKPPAGVGYALPVSAAGYGATASAPTGSQPNFIAPGVGAPGSITPGAPGTPGTATFTPQPGEVGQSVPIGGGSFPPAQPFYGTLVVRPVSGSFMKDIDLIGKMDPYLVFHVGEQIVKSQVCKSGGQHPVWQEALNLPINGHPEIKLEVMDKDLILKDDVIGEAMLSTASLASQNGRALWYPIFDRKKQHMGYIQLATDPVGQAGGFGPGTGVNAIVSGQPGYGPGQPGYGPLGAAGVGAGAAGLGAAGFGAQGFGAQGQQGFPGQPFGPGITGNLTVKPQTAKLLKNADWIGKMDPYAVITIGQQQFKTQVADGQGLNPQWIDQFLFQVQNQNTMNVKLYDKDVIGKDDFIGETNVNLLQATSKPSVLNWYPLLDQKGQAAGQIFIATEFLPQGATPNQYMQNINQPNRAPRNILDFSFGSYNRMNPGYTPQPVVPGPSSGQRAPLTPNVNVPQPFLPTQTLTPSPSIGNYSSFNQQSQLQRSYSSGATTGGVQPQFNTGANRGF